MASTFTHLHTHSHYSLLKALPKVPDLVKAAKDAGCTALALTDIDTLYGAIDFYKECRDAGIKPIIGVDITLEGNVRIILLAENFAGYQNLLALITQTRRLDYDYSAQSYRTQSRSLKPPSEKRFS
jgi:DNA polymerase-3 subunit alpha